MDRLGEDPLSAHLYESFDRGRGGTSSMACDEMLAERIRSVLRRRRGISEKKMFGGIAFLLRGKLICGVIGDDLMVRVGSSDYEAALARAHVREMDFSGRPLKGFVYVGAPGVRNTRQLKPWVERGLELARSSRSE